MARLPYADIDSDATRDLVERMIAERGDVLHLYRMLLHSPPLAEGWLTFLTAVRQQCALPGDVRELVIMRVAVLNAAPYEADQHRPIALRTGLTAEQLDSIGDWSSTTLFDRRQQDVLSLTDAMTSQVQVSETLMARVSEHFDARQVVELVATIAAYNMVSRFLEALKIYSDDGADS